MNAEQAKKLSIENQNGLENALKAIENQAKTGYRSAAFYTINEEAVQGLMKLGYKVTIHKDPIMGTEIYLCIW